MKKNTYSFLFICIYVVIVCFYSCSNKDSFLGSREVFKQECFDEFYKKFLTDSLFQLERVIFPLPGKYIEGHYSNYNMIWTKENYEIIREIGEEDLEDLNISQTVTDSLIIIRTEGKNFNFIFQETYKNIKGKWFLSHLIDVYL